MPSLDQRLSALRGLAPGLRAAAARAALPALPPHERDAMVGILLETPDRPTPALWPSAEPREPPAVPWLLARWALLSDRARAAVLRAAGPGLSELLIALTQSPSHEDRRAAASLAVACVAQPALAAAGGQATASPRAPALDQALAAAARGYPDHRQDAVLSAVAHIAHAAGPAVTAWLADPEQASHMQLRAAARSLAPGPMRARVVAWLGVPALAPLARERLERSTDSADRQAWLSDAHLLRARGRAAHAARLAPSAPLLSVPDPEAQGHAEPLSARMGRPVWALATRREDALHQAASLALEDEEPAVRLAAVRAVSRSRPSPRTMDVLSDFAFDPHPGVAALAASALAAPGSDARRRALGPLWRRLERSPHARVREIARLERHERPAAVDELAPLLALAPSGVAPPSATIDDSMAIVLLERAARSRRIDDVAPAVLALASGPRERPAAKAARLLGLLSDPRAPEAIERALAHPVDRVRASAVEALSRRDASATRLAQITGDPAARVRANAVLALLRARRPEAGPALSEMLGDERPAHRVSALWVAQRTRCVGVVGRVAPLASSDPDPRVVARARRCARVLHEALRLGWATPAEQGP